MKRSVHVLLRPGVHALDFAGPVQAIYEANGFGADYELGYVNEEASITTAQGFVIANLQPLPVVTSRDWVVVPGTASKGLANLQVPSEWLQEAARAGARVSSICSGAFALAKARLLDNRTCTTHWKLLEDLRRLVPQARVLDNHLYVRDQNIVTSAGEAAGIDMTLALLQEDHGARLAADVAREMVIYIRRTGESAQGSIYLEHRSHAHQGVHRVQDWIVAHPEQRISVESMAALASVSPRHLTRLFKEATGVTLLQFAHAVKLEVARKLATDTDLSIEQIAARCSFDDARQLRRIWRKRFHSSIRQECRSASARARSGYLSEPST